MWLISPKQREIAMSGKIKNRVGWGFKDICNNYLEKWPEKKNNVQKLRFLFQIHLDLGGLNRNISTLYSFLIPKYRHSIFKCFFRIFPKSFKLYVRNASGKNEIVHTEILAEISKKKAMQSSEHLRCFLSPLRTFSHLLTKVYPCSCWLPLTLSLHQCTPNLGWAHSSVLILINQMLVHFQLL